MDVPYLRKILGWRGTQCPKKFLEVALHVPTPPENKIKLVVVLLGLLPTGKVMFQNG